MNPWYKDYGDFLKEVFPDEGKLQKLALDAGCTCPNRDGSKGINGCIYCNNNTFSPLPSGRQILTEQEILNSLDVSRRFFSGKYPDMKYIAYFQSYTNTYGDISKLESLYRAVLREPDVRGLILGTRPDCLPEEILDILCELNHKKPVIIELGAETSHNSTLSRINRCHTWGNTAEALVKLKQRNLSVGLHFILGLPGETREMMLGTIDKINELKPDTVKFHQLQIVKGTTLEKMFSQNPAVATLFTPEDYLGLCCEIIDRLDKDIAIERFVSSSPAELLIAPKWGLKNYQFTNLLHNLLKARCKSSINS